MWLCHSSLYFLELFDTPKTTREWDLLASNHIAALTRCFVHDQHHWKPGMQPGQGVCSVCQQMLSCPTCAPPDVPTRARRCLCPEHEVTP